MEKTAKMLQISVLLNSRRQIYSPLLLEQLMEEEKKPPSEAWKPASGADVTPLSWNWRNTASSAGRYCFIFHICRTYSLLDSFFFNLQEPPQQSQHQRCVRVEPRRHAGHWPGLSRWATAAGLHRTGCCCTVHGLLLVWMACTLLEQARKQHCAV